MQRVSTRYRWDDFVLDLDSYRLERAGVALSLEPKAFNLLVLMVQRPGHLFSKQEIFEALWPDTAVTDHALTRVVAQLRRVLGDEAREARYLETVPTRGYRWNKPVHEETGPERPTPARQDPPKPPDADLPSKAAKADLSDTDSVGEAREGGRLSGLSAAFMLGIVVLSFLAWAESRMPTEAAPDSAITIRDPRWPVQVTTHAGLDMHPAMSPQGDAIAFVSDRGGPFEIYIRGLGAARPRRRSPRMADRTFNRRGRRTARASRITP